MGIEIVKFRIEGLTPLLMHSPKGMVRSEPKGVMKLKQVPTAADEAEAACDRLPSGQLYLRTIGFRLGILHAAKGRRIGKRGARDVIASALFLTHAEAPLIDPDSDRPLTEYEIDVQRAVVQRQGIMRARPRLNHWACEVEFEFDTDFLNRQWVIELLQLSGKLSGMGDYRPQKLGTYGRYTAQEIVAAVVAKPKQVAAMNK